MSLIRLNDVSIRCENTQILREAFFRLEPGDRVGLIGKNGSGKSTILKLILDQVSQTPARSPTKMAFGSAISPSSPNSTVHRP